MASFSYGGFGFLIASVAGSDVVPAEGRAAWLDQHGVFSSVEIKCSAPLASWEAAGVSLDERGAPASYAHNVNRAIGAALVIREREEHRAGRTPGDFDVTAVLAEVAETRACEQAALAEETARRAACVARAAEICSIDPALATPGDEGSAAEVIAALRIDEAGALRRWLGNVEQAKRVAFVTEHGTPSQVARAKEDRLPERELEDLVRDVYLPAGNLPLFAKILEVELPHDRSCGGDVSFDTREWEEALTEADFARLCAVRKLHPDAEVTVIEHRADCDECAAEITGRLGVRARVERFGVKVAREYAIGGATDEEIKAVLDSIEPDE